MLLLACGQFAEAWCGFTHLLKSVIGNKNKMNLIHHLCPMVKHFFFYHLTLSSSTHEEEDENVNPDQHLREIMD